MKEFKYNRFFRGKDLWEGADAGKEGWYADEKYLYCRVKSILIPDSVIPLDSVMVNTCKPLDLDMKGWWIIFRNKKFPGIEDGAEMPMIELVPSTGHAGVKK